jgi:hypothetical protein
MELRYLTFRLPRPLLNGINYYARQYSARRKLLSRGRLSGWEGGLAPGLSSLNTSVIQGRRGQAHLPNHELLSVHSKRCQQGFHEFRSKTDNNPGDSPIIEHDS